MPEDKTGGPGIRHRRYNREVLQACNYYLNTGKVPSGLPSEPICRVRLREWCHDPVVLDAILQMLLNNQAYERLQNILRSERIEI